MCVIAPAQKSIGVEQSVYYSKQADLVFVPVISLQGKNNWYAETRFNYEDYKTVSFHLGKSFSKEGKLSYTFTPILGGLVGNSTGVSLGSNIEVNYKKLNWFTQTQHVFSKEDFFYTWSELFYSATTWLYVGGALQHTYLKNGEQVWEPGAAVGFSVRNVSFTVYDFVTLPAKDQTFVISLIFQKEK